MKYRCLTSSMFISSWANVPTSTITSDIANSATVSFSDPVGEPILAGMFIIMRQRRQKTAAPQEQPLSREEAAKLDEILKPRDE